MVYMQMIQQITLIFQHSKRLKHRRVIYVNSLLCKMSSHTQKSITTSAPDFDRSPKLRIDRFQRLDADHIKALESVLSRYPILQGRMEIHLPGHKAKQIFQNDTMWIWPKFDRRPANYLIFIDGYAPCVWDTIKHEGHTLRWILPPNLCSRGPIICLANLLKAENTLQIEDLIVWQGTDIWSTKKFSDRWEDLRSFWGLLPPDQPLLGIIPRIVKPFTLSQFKEIYDASLSWIIQSDCVRAPRWFWWDSVTPVDHKPYHPPALKRAPEVNVIVCALAKPYLKLGLPDTYTLYSQEGIQIGIASIRSIDTSLAMRKAAKEMSDGIPVEVEWDDDFHKYQIKTIKSEGTPIAALSFFPNAKVGENGTKTFETNEVIE